MKKAAGIISLLIMLSMILLSFSACGKKVPLSERLDEAMQKIADSKVLDCEFTGKVVVSMEGVTIDAPMTVNIKNDMRDENNPKSSMDIKFNLMNQEFEIKSCVVDGMNYSDMMGTKIKSPATYNKDEFFETYMKMDFEHFCKIISDSYSIENTEMTEEKDGAFKVKYVTDVESAIFIMIFDLFTDECLLRLGKITVELNIDKDNNIVSYLLDMSMGLLIEKNTIDYNMTFDIVHNTVGDDFKIEAPADADSYVYSFDS